MWLRFFLLLLLFSFGQVALHGQTEICDNAIDDDGPFAVLTVAVNLAAQPAGFKLQKLLPTI